MALSVGTKAPDFTLKSKNASGLADVKLSDNFGKKNTVLLFFPLAFTGVCTTEMCDITAGLGAYTGLNADVIARRWQARRARLHSLFTELRAFVASHQLQPTVHVQYFRQAFQRSADESSVRITLDTRLSMRAARGRDPLGGFSGPAPASPAAVGQRSSWVVSKRRSRALSSRPCWASAPRFWS